MRTGMHYMLLAPLDDAKQSVLVFPTWPVDKWDVDFKVGTSCRVSCAV